MKREQLPSYYPVFLNISGKRCVVVGGGQVARRKVKALLEHGASVEVISPDLCFELKQLVESRTINVRNREYQAGDLKDAFVVIGATSDSETNIKVAAEAQENGLLVNVADDARSSNFVFSSYLRRGDVTVAVSTAGRSPALARRIRTKLEKDFGDEYASLAILVDEVRAEVKRQGIKVNGNSWQEALDLDLLVDLVRRGDNEKVMGIILSRLKGQQKY